MTRILQKLDYQDIKGKEKKIWQHCQNECSEQKKYLGSGNI
jgi:hypothetical protein